MINLAFFNTSKRTQLNPKRTQFFDTFGDILGKIRPNKGSFGDLLACRGPIIATGRVLFDQVGLLRQNWHPPQFLWRSWSDSKVPRCQGAPDLKENLVAGSAVISLHGLKVDPKLPLVKVDGLRLYTSSASASSPPLGKVPLYS